MLRIVVVVVSSVLVAACDVGEIPGFGPDGGGSAGGDGSSNVCEETVTPALAAHAHAAGGTSNAGQACQAAGCHGVGATPQPVYTFSGTVYATAAADAPKPGATIKVTFGSTTLTAVSDADGNFYSTEAVTFPATTLGTACPTIAPMVTGLVAGQGNCNECHRNGGTTLPVYVQ